MLIHTQALAADRRRAVADFEKARQESDQVAVLLRSQQERRADLEGKIAMLETAQAANRRMFLADQFAARRQLRAGVVAELRERRTLRAQSAPKGLAAFLGKVTGVSLALKKLHEHRDRQRVKTYRAERDVLTRQQTDDRAVFDKRQELKAAALMREQRGLGQIEKKELASLQQALRREHRQKGQERHLHSPTFALTLSPPGRPAAPHKAANRHISETKRVLEEEGKKRMTKTRPINLIDEFTRAASDDDDDGGGGGDGDTGGPKPPTKPRGPDKPKGPGRSSRRKRRRRDKDYGRGM